MNVIVLTMPTTYSRAKGPRTVSSALLLCAMFLLAFAASAQVILPPDPDLQNQPSPQGSSGSLQPMQSPMRLGSAPAAPSPSPGMPAQVPLSEQLGEAALAPPREIVRLPPLWPYYLAASLLGLLLLVAALLWMIRRNRRPRPIPVIPADVQALSALEKLRPLIHEARAREFAYQASEIIRGYIEDRFDLNARNRTTHEFLSEGLSEARGISSSHHCSLQQFLQFCDLAKFAKHILTPDQLDAMYQSAAGFIRDTRPSIMAAPTPPSRELHRKEAELPS